MNTPSAEIKTATPPMRMITLSVPVTSIMDPPRTSDELAEMRDVRDLLLSSMKLRTEHVWFSPGELRALAPPAWSDRPVEALISQHPTVAVNTGYVFALRGRILTPDDAKATTLVDDQVASVVDMVRVAGWAGVQLTELLSGMAATWLGVDTTGFVVQPITIVMNSDLMYDVDSGFIFHRSCMDMFETLASVRLLAGDLVGKTRHMKREKLRETLSKKAASAKEHITDAKMLMGQVVADASCKVSNQTSTMTIVLDEAGVTLESLTDTALPHVLKCVLTSSSVTT